MAQDNPLSDRPATQKAPTDDMHRHAMMWKHAGTVAPNEIDTKISQLDHILPVLGALAHNPNTTSKDVIKAVANTAAKRVISPTDAVKVITMMPPKDDDLIPWLRDLYAQDLSMVIHLKAAKLAQAQQAQMGGGMAQPAAAAPPPQMPGAAIGAPGGGPLAAPGGGNPLSGAG